MTKIQLPLSKAFAELEQIAKEFEEQEIDLDNAIPKYKRAVELAIYVKERLSEVTNQIEEISASLNEDTTV